uniref:Uncharacterized protein n=1 Tax=Pan paniscus TaxID=9597 RepID=A0A2R9BAF7_PANPA
MSAMYLSCEELSAALGGDTPPPSSMGHRSNTRRGYPHVGGGHPHVLGLNAGLLGPDVAVVLITLVVSLALFQVPPLTLRGNEPGEVGVQLALLVDAPLLNAVPALLLRDSKSAGDVVPEVQPLLLGQAPTSLQIGDGLIIALHLQLALPQEEVRLHRLPVQLQGAPAVGQGLLVLLHLQVAQGPVGVIHGHQRVPAGRRLRVLSAHEQTIALLLELLRARALLGASAASAQPCAALLLLLALHGAARHGLGCAPKLRASRPSPAPSNRPIQRPRPQPPPPAPARERSGFPRARHERCYGRARAPEGGWKPRTVGTVEGDRDRWGERPPWPDLPSPPFLRYREELPAAIRGRAEKHVTGSWSGCWPGS